MNTVISDKGDLWAERSLRVEESSPELTVLPGGDDTLALAADTTRSSSQRTRHVTQVSATWRHVLRRRAYLCTHFRHDTMVVTVVELRGRDPSGPRNLSTATMVLKWTRIAEPLFQTTP